MKEWIWIRVNSSVEPRKSINEATTKTNRQLSAGRHSPPRPLMLLLLLFLFHNFRDVRVPFFPIVVPLMTSGPRVFLTAWLTAASAPWVSWTLLSIDSSLENLHHGAVTNVLFLRYRALTGKYPVSHDEPVVFLCFSLYSSLSLWFMVQFSRIC